MLYLKTIPYWFKYGIDFQKNYITLTTKGLIEKKWYKKKYGLSETDDPIEDYLQNIYRNPNRIFDTLWYTKHFIHREDIIPLLHYSTYHWENEVPVSKSFDPKEYLLANPDLKEYDGNLLQHYILHGKHEGRRLKKFRKFKAIKGVIKSHTYSEFVNLEPKKNPPVVDVIIPVYRGFNDTINCIYHVLTSSNELGFNTIVINDKSPEEQLSEFLRKLQCLGLIMLIENEENLGFVKTVNKGMQISNRDVILLNSDTEVYNNWIDRIYAHTEDNNVFTITPLSNNATICSYPDWPNDNPYMFEVPFSKIDSLTNQVNKGNNIEIPTGVGFCMFIKRKALNKIGFFNEEAFSKGYGEENDFCMRAQEVGGKNILAYDVFVRHTGEVSFAESAKIEKEKGLKSLLMLHPDYNKKVHDHIKKDPGKKYRQLLDLARIGLINECRENVLIISHNWGGGILRYLKDRLKSERKKNRNLLVITPDDENSSIWNLNAIDSVNVPNLSGLSFEDDQINWKDWLSLLNISHVEIHSLAGWDEIVIKQIPIWCNKLEINYQFFFHDYLSVCPNIHLINADGQLCHPEKNNICTFCRDEYSIDTTVWRSKYYALLKGASRLSAPSTDTVRRVECIFNDLSVECIPHLEEHKVVELNKKKPDGNLTIGIIGAIGIHKGSEVVLDCVKYSEEQERTIAFNLIGTINNSELENYNNIEITGRYEEDDVYRMIEESNVDVIFIPSIWPETYCYTLSIGINSNKPVAAFDLGAQRDRLMEYEKGIIIPYEYRDKPNLIIDEILKYDFSIPSEL